MKHINSGHSLLDIRLSFFFKSGLDQHISKRFTAKRVENLFGFYAVWTGFKVGGSECAIFLLSSREITISVLIVTMLAGPSKF